MLFYFIFLQVILKLQNRKKIFLAKPHGLRNLSSLTEDWTQGHISESTKS